MVVGSPPSRGPLELEVDVVPEELPHAALYSISCEGQRPATTMCKIAHAPSTQGMKL